MSEQDYDWNPLAFLAIIGVVGLIGCILWTVDKLLNFGLFK